MPADCYTRQGEFARAAPPWRAVGLESEAKWYEAFRGKPPRVQERRSSASQCRVPVPDRPGTQCTRPPENRTRQPFFTMPGIAFSANRMSVNTSMQSPSLKLPPALRMPFATIFPPLTV